MKSTILAVACFFNGTTLKDKEKYISPSDDVYICKFAKVTKTGEFTFRHENFAPSLPCRNSDKGLRDE